MKVEVPFVNANGKTETKTADLVNFVANAEPWSEYLLEDGTLVRMKQTAMRFAKLDDVVGADGKPLYNIQTQPTIVILPKI